MMLEATCPICAGAIFIWFVQETAQWFDRNSHNETGARHQHQPMNKESANDNR
jgi:hypothetical protein